MNIGQVKLTRFTHCQLVYSKHYLSFWPERMKTLHPIQISILEKLLFTQWLKFTDLKSDENIPSNQLTFHINVLLEEGLLEKADQLYCLTPSGKLYANSKDSHREADHKFQKIGVLMAATRQTKDGIEYLMYTRKKHPFFGKQGFPTGKVRWWEQPTLTAQREIVEETWMSWEAKVIKLFHFINKNKDNVVIEDKYLFLCHISEPAGDIISNAEGDFYRVAKKKIREAIQNPFDAIDDLLGMTDTIENFTGQVAFEEIIAYPEWF